MSILSVGFSLLGGFLCFTPAFYRCCRLRQNCRDGGYGGRLMIAGIMNDTSLLWTLISIFFG